MASKTVTREQAETKKDQAAALMRRTGQPDRADEFESMTVDEWAEQTGRTLTNPRRNMGRRNCYMATPSNGGNGAPTKADLQDQLDQIQEILEAAYDPESSREDLARAVGDAIDVISGEEEEEEEEDEEDLDDDDDPD